MELKPCPFCGSDRVAVHDWLNEHPDHSYCGFCKDCETEGSPSKSVQGVIDKWNKRKISNVQYAEVLVEWMKDPKFAAEYNSLQTVSDRLVEMIVEEERKSGT